MNGRRRAERRVPARSDMGSAVLSRLLTAGGFVGAGYLAAILIAVLVGCLADEQRRADARRVLALLLFRPAEPDHPKKRPRRPRRAVTDQAAGKAGELPAGPDAEP